MENYKDPTSLFKQTNFSKTIWWKLKVNISGYQNETENKLVTEICKNRIFKLLYPNIHQENQKFLNVSLPSLDQQLELLQHQNHNFFF